MSGDERRADYELLNRTMAAYTVHFLQRDMDDGYSDGWEPWIHRHLSWCKRYLAARTFPREAEQTLRNIDDDILFQRAKELNVSYLVVLLDLTRLWIQSVPSDRLPAFSVSRKKLSRGFRAFAVGMLRIKRHDPDRYRDYKKLMANSREAARYIWGAFNRHILAGSHHYKEEQT